MSPEDVKKAEQVVTKIEPQVPQSGLTSAADLKKIMGELTSAETREALKGLIVCIECSESPTGECDYCANRGFTYQASPPSGTSWKDYVITKCNGSEEGVTNPHGHHIVPKKAFGDSGKKARNILCKYGINPYIGCENLVISRNWCHNEAYRDYLLSLLEAADRTGERTAVVKALGDIAVWHEDCGGRTGAAAANTESDD